MIDERGQNVYGYHVRALLELGCIELVSTAQRRGAIEHYYRALTRPFFSDRDWKRLPRSGREQAVTDLTLQMIWEETASALKKGSFENRTDRHLSRSPLTLDEERWAELNDLLAKVLTQSEGIAAKSAKRLAKSEADGDTDHVCDDAFRDAGAGRALALAPRAARATAAVRGAAEPSPFPPARPGGARPRPG